MAGHGRSLAASRSAYIERLKDEREFSQWKEGDRIPPSERLFRIFAGSVAVSGLGIVAASFGDAAGYVIASVKITSDLHSFATPTGVLAAQTIQDHWVWAGALIGGLFGAGKALGIEGVRNCLKGGLTGKEPPSPKPWF